MIYKFSVIEIMPAFQKPRLYIDFLCGEHSFLSIAELDSLCPMSVSECLVNYFH